MIGAFQNIKIQGMASAVPKIVEENENYKGILGDRRTKKQIKLTGVSKRHISGEHQRTSDLCYVAATALLKQLGWKKDEIKVLILVTQSANYVVPSTSFFLQKRLGLSKDCVVFDINLGCSAFNVGVHVVSALMQSCQVSDKALLLIGDTSSHVLKPDEKLDEEVITSRMLFGSAGSAIALEKVENSSLRFMTKSDGNGFEAIICHPKRTTMMNGTDVFEFAINDVADDVKVFKQHFGLQEEDIDYYVFHQAQKLILDNIAAVCEIPEEKELRSLEEYGNTSGASVPLTVCVNRDRFQNQDSVKLYLCGFGVGLSWGSIYAEIPTCNILPVIETDEHYDEDKKLAEGLQDKYILVMDSDKPLGESICRYLNSKSARVVLAGQDIDKLKCIHKDLFMEAHVAVTEEQGTCTIEGIMQYCSRCDIKLDGVVFADETISCGQIKEILSALIDKEHLKESASVVILSDIDTLRSTGNKEEYADRKQKLDEDISAIQEQLAFDRINAVLYDRTKMDLVQIVGDGQEWIEQFLKDGCLPERKKSIYIGETVKYLLSDNSAYTAGTLLSVNL